MNTPLHDLLGCLFCLWLLWIAGRSGWVVKSPPRND